MPLTFGANSTSASLYAPSQDMDIMDLLGIVFCTNPDLLRTVLCPNGRQCAGHRDGSCCFAHSMAALMPPDESIRDHTAAWNGFVDQWYGQAMGQVQLHRIQKYYVDTPPFERPVWAKGLAWYVMEKHVARAPECGWDWGIRSDADAVFWRRCIRGRPFA